MEAIRAATWEAQRKAKEELYGCSEGDKMHRADGGRWFADLFWPLK